jgi:hypothetical protein
MAAQYGRGLAAIMRELPDSGGDQEAQVSQSLQHEK